MVNACSGGGSEGENEYAILYNDSNYLHVNSSSIQLKYGASFPPSTTYTDTFVSIGNPNYVNALNAYLNGSCDFSFINVGSTDSIPPNRFFILMYEAPSDTIDFSNWCGSGLEDIYVVFSEDGSWSSGGNFVNAPSGQRYFTVVLNSDTSNYSYTNGWSSNKDGNFVSWNDTGSASQFDNYSGCTPTNLNALPVDFVSIRITTDNKVPYLEWVTTSEINNLGFDIQQNDGNEWRNIGFEPGHGNTFSSQSYSFALPFYNKRQWFRLRQVDFDGSFVYSPTVSHTPLHQTTVHYSPIEDRVIVRLPTDEEFSISCIDLFGRKTNLLIELGQDYYFSTTHDLRRGWYIIAIRSRNYLITRKIYVSR